MAWAEALELSRVMAHCRACDKPRRMEAAALATLMSAATNDPSLQDNPYCNQTEDCQKQLHRDICFVMTASFFADLAMVVYLVFGKPTPLGNMWKMLSVVRDLWQECGQPGLDPLLCPTWRPRPRTDEEAVDEELEELELAETLEAEAEAEHRRQVELAAAQIETAQTEGT